MTTRRDFIKTTLTTMAAAASPLALAKPETFRQPFQVPRLNAGQRQGRDVYFDLTVQSGTSRILPNKNTHTWGINQNFLGTTLKAKKGDRVHIKVKNTLTDATTLHWHGMKLPARMDGGPHQPIPSGKNWLSEYEIIQPASTLWYHSHQMHETGPQVYQGLAGLFILEDKHVQSLPLPSEYGVDDIPVILQDRDFNHDGSFRYISSMHDRMAGKQGSVMLVNGVYKPLLKAHKSLIRLRILNGSNARIYHLKFNDQRDFSVIASDGGLLRQPIQTNMVRIAPAERVEIVVDVSDGTMPMLVNHPPEMTSGMGMMRRMMGNREQAQALFQIDARKVRPTTTTIPKTLANIPVPNLSQVSATRTMELEMQMGPQMMRGGGMTINGKSMDIQRIDTVVQANSSEVWRIKNTSMLAHPFHIHNVQFQVLERSKTPLQPHEHGFKDTVLVYPNETVTLYIQFPKFRDAKVPYMYHCHILEHEDAGMMGQFTVV